MSVSVVTGEQCSVYINVADGLFAFLGLLVTSIVCLNILIQLNYKPMPISNLVLKICGSTIAHFNTPYQYTQTERRGVSVIPSGTDRGKDGVIISAFNTLAL